MAGYIINLSSERSLEMYIRNGAYGTIIPRPERGYWSTAREMTLADYLTMKSGDLIFFFLQRRIFGVGRLRAFPCGDDQLVALANYPGAVLPNADPPGDGELYLWREDGEENIRWVVFFDHNPHFFTQGLDMDEVLEADTKGVVRALRVFENRSFIQIDAEEAQVILDLLVRRNQEVIEDVAGHPDRIFPDQTQAPHTRVAQRDLGAYRLRVEPLLRRHSSGGQVRHEALIQAWIVSQLAERSHDATDVFGRWDHIANQVTASPAKPVRYMDHIDIFGHVERRLRREVQPTVVRYKIIEIKKDEVTNTAPIDQVMKYVDWTAHTRCGGDYAMIDAYLVARGFSENVQAYVRDGAARRYVIPRRPYQARDWRRLALVAYEYTGGDPALKLSPLA